MPVYRKDVKLHLCGSSRAKDPSVRAALIDLYPASGGGKCPQIGTKRQPGPLFGVSSHAWPALGVAVLAQSRSRAGQWTTPLEQSLDPRVAEPELVTMFD